MRLNRIKNALGASGILVFCVLAFQNCSDVSFETIIPSNTNLETCLTDPEADCGGETGNTLKAIQPAVAVRGISCLMCHAQIHANVITDFGFGNSFYFGGGAGINQASWYNNYVNSWQSSQTIVGSVYVPNQTIPANIQADMGLAGSAPMSIAQAMVTPYDAPNNWNGGNTPEEGRREMAMKVVPAAAGQQRVVSKAKIVIRAPTETEIQDLAPILFANPDVGVVKMPGYGPVDGLFVQVGPTMSFVTNDESVELQCSKKDIVVKGSLFLHNLRVNASGGCRIYVSGTVFIQEDIIYGAGANQNLQITSANMVSMGFNGTTLSSRLADSRGLEITGARTFAQRADQAILEAQNIVALKDAKTGYGGARGTFNYSGLLINAPVIHSRYLGEIQGAVIAEAAIFALGAFRFHFDPVFTKVDALPLLKKPILAVQ